MNRFEPSYFRMERSLHLVMSSLASQVDQIVVYLDNYEFVPLFLQGRPWITVVHNGSLTNGASMGDAGKFLVLDGPSSSIILTCDDDILYPSNYVDVMIAHLRALPWPAAVGVHGVVLQSSTIGRNGYYASREVSHAFEVINHFCSCYQTYNMDFRLIAVNRDVNVGGLHRHAGTHPRDRDNCVSLEHFFRSESSGRFSFAKYGRRLVRHCRPAQAHPLCGCAASSRVAEGNTWNI
mmetsp:Transcript_17530/g.36403  ORF Transcript_17530/g.36403 Transcript_17530/m.36403 type:complete len:236 (+) Transcript_17530:578-1285(+)